MKLLEFRDANKLKWVELARLLSVSCATPIFECRLNRLRNGSIATNAEISALIRVTDGLVMSYRG